MSDNSDKFVDGLPTYSSRDDVPAFSTRSEKPYESSLTPPVAQPTATNTPESAPVVAEIGPDPWAGSRYPGDAVRSAAVPTNQYNPLAVMALVFSILGFFPVSLVLAFVSLSQMKKYPQAGRGFAIAAIIISVGVVIAGVFLLALTFAVSASLNT